MAGRLSKEDTPAKFPTYYKPLSRRLYKVLEDIGASTEIRDLQTKLSTSEEIVDTMEERIIATVERCSNNATVHRSRYMCGSTFEGTKTPEMQSDVDMLEVTESRPVVLDISDAQFHNLSSSFLMVQDLYTPPGYVKLQLVLDSFPQFHFPADNTAFDIEYRTVLTEHNDITALQVIHGPARSTPTAIISGEVIHGPAISGPETETKLGYDYVAAARCRSIPSCASEWFTRQRHYNWPTTELIEKCRTLGCFFVYVGHPNSEEKHLQWRLSFTLQERLLVTQFNSVQLKCYILMKMIKKDIIHKDVGEKSLTSYHCKTCLLYLIENTPAEFWREDNLLVCLYTYLSKILRCVETMDCPNYFIRDENMFDGRLNGEIQTNLKMVIRSILSADFHFLLKLKTDTLGERFQHVVVPGVQHGRFMPVVNSKKILMFFHVYMSITSRRTMLHRSLGSHSDAAVTGKRLNRLKLKLQNTERVTEHTQEQTKNALSPVCQYIEISHMSVMAALAKSLYKSNAFIFQILTSEKWHLISLVSDQFSSKLKQASLLYMMEFPDVSLDVLLNLERRLRHQLSFCVCSEDRDSCYNVSESPSLEGNTTEELLYNCLIPCVIYLPAEKDLTPTAICYEMNRSIGFPDDNREDWYDWAMVDGKILLYFLLYLNHHHFGMEVHAAADMENIRWLIETDILLGHRETALNLLGWIYKDRGRVDRAVEYFRESVSIQPTHNAAFWHMRDIENVLIIFLSSRVRAT